MNDNNKELLMVVNEDRFFLSHRKDIALVAMKNGWKVRIVCKDTGQRHDVENLGLEMIELPINPTGMNIRQELKTLTFLFGLYRKNRNAIVHHVGLKSILWGGLAARMTRVKGVVNAVSGLGVMFSEDKSSVLQKCILNVLRFSHKGMNVRDVFQNTEDRSLFITKGVVSESQCEFTKGSGVNLEEYHYEPEPETDVIKVLFTARMVKEKGMTVLIEAAEKLRSEYEERAEFWLCGGLSGNPKGIKKDELEAMCDGKYIKWLGHCKNVKDLLMQSHIVAFPSYYREGVPKSLIEACAVGRPIVTTDSVGCRDTVEDGKNGFLVPVRNSDALAEKLKVLFDDKNLRCRMGKYGREKAEREFSIDKVVDTHLRIYEELFAETI